MKYLLLAVLVVAVVVGAYVGCGPRVGVAKDAAIKKIDELLGPLNVKQKEVQTAYDKLKAATGEVHDKRIEAQVTLQRLTEKKAEFAKSQTKIKEDLKKLKQMLSDAETSGSIERNGKQISTEQLKSYADRYIRDLKMVNDKIKSNDTIMSAWAKNLDVLKKQDETSDTQLKKLSDQLDEIQSKKSALDAMKQAANIAGPSTSISDKFNDLTESVDELMLKIDTEYAIEEAKLDERMAEVEMSNAPSIDELLDDKTDVSSTISDIDALLGEGQ